ncbi:MAG: hypothetical protein EXR62_15950 [Chloroflexi bacterium]|nr:hypothetical protein [Chloroflexota bacterium]
MILPQDFKITTEILWRGALMFALMDLPIVAFLAWRTRPGTFRQIKAEYTQQGLVIVAFLYY